MKVGDRVKLIAQSEVGVIIQLLSDTTYEIETSDGFSFIVSSSEIVALERGTNESDWAHTVSSKSIRKSKQEKVTIPVIQKVNSSKVTQTYIIDLHLEQLVKTPSSVKPEEAMDVQLSYFQSQLNTSIKAGKKQLTVIHGKGNGKLRNAVRKELDKCSIPLSYNSSDDNGATHVSIK